MKVKLDELRAAFENVLQEVESFNGETIDIDVDLYWFTPKPQVYDPTASPTGLTIGSLEDDWAQVRAIGCREKEPIVYALVWIASVLRALGEHGTSKVGSHDDESSKTSLIESQ